MNSEAEEKAQQEVKCINTKFIHSFVRSFVH
jgi:hypothetical protein